jgi:hypothetical protein
VQFTLEANDPAHKHRHDELEQILKGDQRHTRLSLLVPSEQDIRAL